MEHDYDVIQALKQINSHTIKTIDQLNESVEVLEKDANTLEKTRVAYLNYKYQLDKAANQLSIIKRKNCIDKTILYSGLCFFFSVVLYILVKRIFY
jgi:hypothetical protein